jgi:hypothetical protein
VHVRRKSISTLRSSAYVQLESWSLTASNGVWPSLSRQCGT